MGRSLRLAHLPAQHQRLRLSGFLTDPSITDAEATDALAPYFLNLTLWRDRTKLPADWPARDDSVIQQPPPGVTPIWGEGDDVSAAAVIGDPQTPWRLLVGRGQLAIENVWLYDAKANTWPESLSACPRCPATTETVTAPSDCRPVRAGAIGALLGSIATFAGLRWIGSRDYF
jgi:hypothetical protein